MTTFQLPVTHREYAPNLGYLRQAIVRDRSPRLSTVEVHNSYDRAVSAVIRHSDLYIVGLDFGQGLHHFKDMPAVGASRQLEFKSDYGALGLRDRKKLILSSTMIDTSIASLSYHQTGENGSQIFQDKKDAIVRLVFVVSEALRNWQVQAAVSGVLASPGSSIDIKDYWGTDRPLSSWQTLSGKADAAANGIFVPHKP